MDSELRAKIIKQADKIEELTRELNSFKKKVAQDMTLLVEEVRKIIGK